MKTSIPIKNTGVFARVFLLCFGAPFVAGGLFGFYAMYQAIGKQDAALKDIFLPSIIGLTFTGAGLFLWWSGLFSAKRVSEDEKRRAAAPEQPWRWRDDWAQGRVNGSAAKAQTGIWLFAIFWNLVSSPLLFILPEEIAKKPVAAVGLLFPVIGVGVLVWAVRATMRAQRFGATRFEMSPLPAVPGGRVAGVIRARFPFPPAQGVNVRLTCLRRTFSGSGKDRSSSESIVWREERTLNGGEVMVAGGEASIPVRFALPADALETSTIEESEAGILWTITADASLEGIDYQDDFEIPVYKTGVAPVSEPDEPRGEQASEAPIFASDRAAQPAMISLDALARAGIAVTQTPDGTQYRFAAGRNGSFALGMAGFFAIWTGSLWLMTHLGAPWIFSVVFGLFDLLFLFIVLDLCFGVTTLTVGNGAVRRVYTMLGMGWRSGIPLENIRKIDLHINMQTSGRHGTPYYALRATFINGRTKDLASGISDKNHAEWLAAELRRAIGLPAA